MNKRIWKKAFAVALPAGIIFMFLPQRCQPVFFTVVFIGGALWICCTELKVDE